MRHFALVHYLAAASLTTSNTVDSLAVNVNTSAAAGTKRGQKLRSAILVNQRATAAAGPVLVDSEQPSTRRSALLSLFGAAVGAAFVPSSATALDMDAFVNSQLDNDTKNCDPKKDSKCVPKLTEDEALCKYGQSGQARGEACVRARTAK